MRLAIEEGVLMVLGREGDPVPPAGIHWGPRLRIRTPARSAGRHQAPASRIAAVLRAQVLGRLGRSAAGSEWILDDAARAGRPELASDDQLVS